MVRFTIGLRGEVPGKRKPMIREQQQTMMGTTRITLQEGNE
jgi:hypothetical protein